MKINRLIACAVGVGTIFVLAFFLITLVENHSATKVSMVQQPDKVSKKDRIDLAMRHEFDMTQDPSLGYIPRVRLNQAQEIRKNKLIKSKSSQSRIAGVTWTERGPNNVGGRTRAMMWDPNDPDNKKVWAGSVTGGLWYNNDITNDASQWQSVSEDWNNIAISALAHDPNDPKVMYVGTGEGHVVGSTRGEGMYKSIDGGISWTHMTTGNGFYSTDDSFHYVNDILVKEENGVSVLYVATQESLNAYSYYEYAASGDRGLWRSTDGGVTFTQVLPNVAGESYTYAVADIEISASGRIYIGTTKDYNGAAGGYYNGGGNILYSDDGQNWTIAYNPGTGNRVELACAPSNANVVYAVSALGGNVDWMVRSNSADRSDPYWATLNVPRYKSQSGCGNTTDDFARGQAWYNLILSVHPTDESTVILGGIDLYRSTDNGNNFNLVSYWTGGCDMYVHADQHQVLFNPDNVNEMIVGNDGGVYYSADITESDPVIVARNNGYNVTQFYGAAIHPEAGKNHFLAGAQDNGSQLFKNEGVNATVEVSGGDGAFCSIDQDEPTYQWTQYVYNQYYRSKNGGITFRLAAKFGNQTGRFINPSSYDNARNIMYAAAGRDELLRWSDPQTGSNGTFVSINSLDGGQISSIAVSPNTANRIFVGTGANISDGITGGKIYRIDNAHTGTSATAIDITSPDFPANGYISCIEVETGDDDHMLVTFSNYGVSSIWETTDGGSSWREVEGDLPDMPVRWALFHPLDNSSAIIATELGVWTTNNLKGSDTNWGPASGGMPNVRTDMLQLRESDNEIIAATHGRGLFSSSSFQVPPTTDPEIAFTKPENTQEERSEAEIADGDCRSYKDYNISMGIANPPVGDATVTLNLTPETTAAEWADFAFTTNNDFSSNGKSNTLLFENGKTEDKSFTLRIYDDAAIENPETVVLGFDISGATDASKSPRNTSYTFTILDNENNPSATGKITLLTEDFEGGTIPSEWFVGEEVSSNNLWRVGDKNNISGTYSAYVSENEGSANYNPNDNTKTFLISPLIDASELTNLNLSFDYICNGELLNEVYFDYGRLAYSFDGKTFEPFGDYFQGVTTATNYTTNLPAILEDKSFHIAFYWENDGSVGGFPAFAVDDIQLSGIGTTTIASTINSSALEHLGPYETVLFHDKLTGDVLAKVQNTSAHDYGCTTVTIDRAGTGVAEFWSGDPSEYLMEKTVMINPSHNNVNGSYNITLYYSKNEVDNWMAATGKTLNDLKLAKVNTPISSVNATSIGDFDPELSYSSIPSNIGEGYAITSSFTTGFSGFGAGDPGDPPPALPLTLVEFDVKLVDNDAHVIWYSASEENTDYINIEHSSDGENFETIGRKKAAGNSVEMLKYSFKHMDIDYGNHFYRLKMVDLDGSFEYSAIKKITQKSSNFEVLNVYPVPTKTNLNVRLNNDNSDPLNVKLIDQFGKVQRDQLIRTNLGTNTFEVDCSSLRNGVYILSLNSKGRSINKKILVRK
ncbi:T9SS type A sorting domain-containing protein [Fulvivirga sp. RKSG066]|nr:T9SS type A sorting domain-containing protein [Fulvivirga aurantia]